MERIDINNLPDVIQVKTRKGDIKEIELRLPADLKNILQSKILPWFDKDGSGFLEEKNDEQQYFYEFCEKYIKDGEVTEWDVIDMQTKIGEAQINEANKKFKEILTHYRNNDIKSVDELDMLTSIWTSTYDDKIRNEILDILTKTAVKKNNYFNYITSFFVEKLHFSSQYNKIPNSLIEFGPKTIPLIKKGIEKSYKGDTEDMRKRRIRKAIYTLTEIAIKNKESTSEVESVLKELLKNPNAYPDEIENSLKKIGR